MRFKEIEQMDRLETTRPKLTNPKYAKTAGTG